MLISLSQLLFGVIGVFVLLGLLYFLGVKGTGMKRQNDTKQHDAFAEMFVEEIQLIKRQPQTSEKEHNEDPMIVFAYWVLLPMFFASVTILMIALFNLIF